MAIKLSICIPTFNRDKRLRQLLEQLCSLVDSHPSMALVEICISDNGSGDETWALLRDFDDRYVPA